MVSIIVSVVLVVLIVWFFVSNTRHKKDAIEETDQHNFRTLLEKHISYFEKLDEKEKLRFEEMVDSFLKQVNIEGIEIAITDEDRIMIASSAIIPIFGFPEWKYSNLTNIILYPDTFNNDFQFEGENSRNILGMVGSGYMNGQMILSKAALVKGFSKNSGSENAAIHEFVHLVDSADGAIDGVPEISDYTYAEPWLQMMHKEISRIKESHSDINPYAATNEAEFLAVTGEYFFEKPAKFKAEHPELYEQLAAMFNQHPAGSNKHLTR